MFTLHRSKIAFQCFDERPWNDLSAVVWRGRGPCKIEIPGFIDLYDKYKAQGLEVVGVVLLDKFENAKPFADTMKMNYEVLNGDEQQDAIDNAYGPLFGLPMSFIISRDGKICQKHLGLPGATKDKDPDAKSVQDVFEAQIKALL